MFPLSLSLQHIYKLQLFFAWTYNLLWQCFSLYPNNGCVLFLSNFNKNQCILKHFSKNPQHKYLIKIIPAGMKLLHADRWTDTHDEAISHFSQLSSTHTSKGDWNKTASIVPANIRHNDMLWFQFSKNLLVCWGNTAPSLRQVSGYLPHTKFTCC